MKDHRLASGYFDRDGCFVVQKTFNGPSNFELKNLLNDTLQALRDSGECFDLKCPCEGNEKNKELAKRIKNTLQELEEN